MPNEGYNLLNVVEYTGISQESDTVIEFLHTQTAYINAMNTYSKVNTAVQSAAEHLALTQLGMKVRLRAWGQYGVEVIIK